MPNVLQWPSKQKVTGKLFKRNRIVRDQRIGGCAPTPNPRQACVKEGIIYSIL